MPWGLTCVVFPRCWGTLEISGSYHEATPSLKTSLAGEFDLSATPLDPNKRGLVGGGGDGALFHSVGFWRIKSLMAPLRHVPISFCSRSSLGSQFAGRPCFDFHSPRVSRLTRRRNAFNSELRSVGQRGIWSWIRLRCCWSAVSSFVMARRASNIWMEPNFAGGIRALLSARQQIFLLGPQFAFASEFPTFQPPRPPRM